jgi:DNA-binding XRE family transcriptional regulator
VPELDANKVREWRNYRALTQQEAADLADTSLFTWQRIERGQGGVRAKTIRAVADALDVEVADLFRGAEVPKASARPSGFPAAQSPGVRDEAVQEMVLDAMKRQLVKEGQAFNRADESRSAQAISMDPENEVFAHLLELPKGEVEDAFLALAKKHLLLQDENAALQDANAALREAAREHA